jgi:dTDP-4-amino-4,6-dideoxygalactose transaminase
LHPVKSITSGEGGIITTNNKKYYEKLKILRNHGIIRKNNNKKYPWIYKINEIGLNYRMNEMQAALAYSQFKRLKKFITKRRGIAKVYDKILSINDKIYLPQSQKKIRASSALHLYVICLNNKKSSYAKSQLIAKLKKYGIGSQVHYIPVYKLNAFKKIKKINNLSNTEQHYQNCLSIPCYFDLSFSKAKFIANKINQLLLFRQ